MSGFVPFLTRAALLGVSGVSILGACAGAGADEIKNNFGTTGTLAARTVAKLNASQPSSLQTTEVLQAALRNSLVAAPKARQLDPVSVASHIVPISLRLGALVSPRTKFVGGADFSFPNAKIGPFYPRIDAEAIVSANFGAISTLVPITFNGVYSKTLPAGTHLYGGAGIGPYFGEVTRFGGKLFIGGDFNRSIGVEADLQFAGQGEALVSVVARIGL